MNKIFSEVCNFKYKNAKYKLFVDSNNRIFFLKSLSNNQLSYVTEEELVELQRIFCKKSLAFNVSKNKVSFIPKIISLASATAIVLTLQSCKSLDNKYTYGNINSYDYDADKEAKDYKNTEFIFYQQYRNKKLSKKNIVYKILKRSIPDKTMLGIVELLNCKILGIENMK